MKKNISINISGIIFHIEEDGYGKLKEYLESINSYFSSYEDSQEIIADIESRIAEIFLTKLDDGKQVITMDDVNALIATMGTTADFEAIEDDIPPVTDEKESTESKQEEQAEEQTTKERVEPKKLFRDEKRRILGGVASGIAHYFGIDPLWVRLIAAILFLNVFFGPVSGLVFLAYIILWIVVPGSHDLKDEKDIKKMYRDPDGRVLGGVASGIAAYFGADSTVIRLIFVLSIFLGGSGLILYIILWIITPEANSITEKMQMQGEPVTLSNIEQNVKDSLNVKEGDENLLVKILLFPFRVIAAIFQALGKLLGPASKFLVEVLRVIAGLVITIIGLSGMIGLIVTTAVMLGIVSAWSSSFIVHDVPLELIKNSFPTFSYIAMFIASIVPLLGVCLIGISILAKKWVLNATIGWSIFGLWVLSMIGVAFTVPKIVSDFSAEGEYRESKTFDFGARKPVLALNDAGILDYDMVNLKIRGYSDSIYKLDMRYRARGNSRQNAIDNSKMVTYNVNQEGSNLYFDSNMAFKENAIFRVQELNMVLYVPYDREFIMEEGLKYILLNTLHPHGYKAWQLDGNTWKFTEDGLECTTCKGGRSSSYERRDKDKTSYYGDEMTFEMKDFEHVEVKGNIGIVITQDDEYFVQVKGKDKYLDEVIVKQIGDLLTIEMDTDVRDYLKSDDKKPVKVFITTPSLDGIKGAVASDFYIADFDTDELSVTLSGTSSGDLDLDTEVLQLRLKGGSSLKLSGETKEFEADISGGSSLKAYDLSAKRVSIEASGASSARVYAKDKLYAESSGMSSIKYKGRPEVSIEEKDDLSAIDGVD